MKNYAFPFQLQLELLADNSVKVLKTPESLTVSLKGLNSWTMIYDEGFEIILGDLRLFHFSQYEKKQGSRFDV